MLAAPLVLLFFFFNDTATTEIYTLSLHDALPIFDVLAPLVPAGLALDLWHGRALVSVVGFRFLEDRKSTRLNSSHGYISYAVFCLKKKKTNDPNEDPLHYPRAECTANCRYSQSHH